MFKDKRAYIETLVLFVIVMVTKYLFDATDIYGDTYTGDSHIFTLIGQAWSDGIIPYRDLFDHKGPILFLFYAIAAWIQNSIVGIMIVTAINMTIVLRLILSISRKLLPKQSNKIHYLVVISSLIFFRLTHESVGISEELSLVFILLPLLLCVKHLTKVANGIILFSQHPYSYSFAYGACFAAIAMIRVNNAPMNIGIVLGFLILMLKDKHYKELLYNALYCLLGFLAVVLPIIAYFHYHDALYEMVYATFIFNWNYRSADVQWYKKDIIQNILWLIPCFYLIVASILRDRKYGGIYSYFFTPASIVCICAFINGYSFIHYFVNALPFFILSVIFTYELLVSKKKYILFLICILLLIPYYKGVKTNLSVANHRTIKRDRIAEINNEEINKFKKFFSIIPQSEYNSIYSYASWCIPLLIKYKIRPIGKYFTLNDRQSQADKEVMQEQDEFHRTTTVKWIISNEITLNNSSSKSFTNMLQKYELVSKYGIHYLYRRKDSADEIDVSPMD